MMKEISEIVRKSIRDIVCIDDDYVSPYEKETKKPKKKAEEYKTKFHFSKKMYCGMSKNEIRSVCIIPFSKSDSCFSIDRHLKNKDLLVLDWELTTPPQSRYPLEIIENSVKNRVKYVCIYTQELDTMSIRNQIALYYRYGREELDAVKSAALRAHIMKQIFMAPLTTFYMGNRDATELKKLVKDEELQCKRDVFNVDDVKMWEKLYLSWNQVAYFPDSNLKRNVNEFNDVMQIDDTFILFFNKRNGTGVGICEKDIINRISQIIVKEPNSILNAIWLFYTNTVEESLDKAGNYFEGLDWKAFAYYANRLSEGYSNEEMFSFLSKIFMKRLSQSVEAEAVPLPDALIDEVKKKGKKQKITEQNADSYSKLNYFLNVDNSMSMKKHYLTFGDVLCSGGEYFICVSPTCTCAKRASSPKCNTDFFMVRGQADKDIIRFEKVEKDNYCFICKTVGERSNYLAIKWNEGLTSLHCDNPEVAQNLTLVGLKNGEKTEFTYVCKIADEYAQRIANSAYSFENRVGVSFANSYNG